MADMLKTITPKSDQLNSDDLIGRTLTIKVTKVSLLAGEQPIAINYEGDSGKPYKPCKSMRRVMVHVWGNDGNAYVGRRMTLYRDEKVQFGGAAVGGIRISHMSDIEEPVMMALTTSKTNRRPFTVKPLPLETENDKGNRAKALANEIGKALKEAETPKEVEAIWKARAADLDTVKAASARAYEALCKLLKEHGSKETAPSDQKAEEELSV